MKYLGLIVILTAILIGVFYLTKTKTLQTETQNKVSKNTSVEEGANVSKGSTPTIPFNLSSNFTIHVFANGLGQARDLQFTPEGTLLVSIPNSNKVIAMPDKNKDGVADDKKVVINKGSHIHGLAFFDGKLYVADVDKVVRYNWDEQNLQATEDKVLFSLPKNGDHNNRTLTFDKAGNMYVSVGSTCNVCVEQSNLSATIIKSNANGDNPQVFATGLRNAPFTQINPKTGDLWGTEMGRDNLGDDLPPDEINIIKNGKNYGWPNCYGNKVHDSSFDKNNEKSCENTQEPLFTIPAHSAPLGLTFINSNQFPKDWQNDLLVAYHGSWNRSTPIGYKVIHLKVDGDKITSSQDFLTGFQQGNVNGTSLGRPVDLTFDSSGNLYLTDDKAGNIYIIQKN